MSSRFIGTLFFIFIKWNLTGLGSKRLELFRSYFLKNYFSKDCARAFIKIIDTVGPDTPGMIKMVGLEVVEIKFQPYIFVLFIKRMTRKNEYWLHESLIKY